MADNSPLDEALAMVGDTVGPDTPQNVRRFRVVFAVDNFAN